MRNKSIALLLIFCFSGSLVVSQDNQELQAEKAANAKLKGEHPLVALSKSKPSSLRKELENVHPRVFMTQADIDALKRKATVNKTLWEIAISRVRALNVEPPKPPAEERRVQNEVGLGIAEAAFIYKITGEKKYLDAAKKYMDAAVSYDIWGYSYNKPNVDLAAGHLLYGMGWAYDLLYHDLTEAEKTKYRDKLIKQARLLYDFFKPKSGKTYAYSQNHTFIPITGLAVAAYTLMGETDEAKDWAAVSRAIYDRVLATYTEDGYFYESMEYWIFSTPWLVHYMDAHAHATGENLYETTPGFRKAHKYVAHITLPGGEFNFDYGDIYAGPITRARKGDDYKRERINGRFRTNYNILYNLANRYNDGEAQGVANWLKSKNQVNAEEIWTFIWYNMDINAVPINQQARWHYFPDHEVVFWRSGWDDNATAVSFKAGPPEGHSATTKVKAFPDWRLSSGHAHPDAGSFIVWSNGRYLTGDSGYAGVPLTEHHNTVTFGGKGQGDEGKGHDAFAGIAYDLMNKILLRDLIIGSHGFSVAAELSSAYQPELGIVKFLRKFSFSSTGEIEIDDRIQTQRDQVITSYLHSDTSIVKSGKLFEFEPGKPSLLVELMQPELYNTVIEPNVLTAPGRPGSVDKGEREERGVRLAISPRSPAKQVQIVVRMKIKP
ncbi:MAG TPA: DUF4962 domain-containing protein [Pyrinomonadaceae bacterium]|nr:DUF4962 domain-containing protein [Pyrinomonadaceae bacterium]